MTREELEERIYDVLLNEIYISYHPSTHGDYDDEILGKSEALKEIMKLIDEAVVHIE